MTESSRIHSPELAEVMAYAEKPYQDLIVSGDKSEHEISVLRELANYAGVAAAREFISDLTSQVDGYDTAPKAESLSETALETSLSEKLNTHVEVFMKDAFPAGMKTRVTNALQRENVKYLRDVLVWGRNNVRDIRTMGTGGLKLIDDSIETILGPETSRLWLGSPGIETVAAICTDISQVSSIVLSFDIRSSYYYWGASDRISSVRSILDIPEEELAMILRPADKRDPETRESVQEPNYAAAAQVKAAAVEYTTRFNEIRSLQK